MTQCFPGNTLAGESSLCHSGRAQGGSRISCRRLNKKLPEGSLAQQPGIGNAVQGHTSGHTKVVAFASAVQVSDFFQQGLLENDLQTASNVLVECRDFSFPDSRRLAEQKRQSIGKHSAFVVEIEILQVQL